MAKREEQQESSERQFNEVCDEIIEEIEIEDLTVDGICGVY